MNQSNHMMTTYHAYLIDFSVPLSVTLAPTKSPYQLSTFCILSKQKLFVPEFVIDRRKDVIKTVKLLPMGTVVRFGLCVCDRRHLARAQYKNMQITKLFSFTNDCYDVSRYVFLIQNVCRRSIVMKKNMHIKRWIASTISLYADWH